MSESVPSQKGKKLRTGPSPWIAAPALAFFGFFALIPLVGVFVLSFMSWDGLGSITFAGVDNWKAMLGNGVTQHAILLTLGMIILCWVIQTPISLLLGVFMAGQQKYRAVLSVLYFLPLLFSATAVGIAFNALLDPNFGMSRAFGLDFLSQDFLGNPTLAFYTIMFVIAWCFVPFHSLLYQGAARQIPKSVMEAAMIDGAGRWQTFWHITLPQLRNTIVTSSTLMIVGSLTYFDLIFVMTAGGPGNATRVLPLDMYLTGFRSYNMGGAAVIGVLLVVVGLTISYLLNKLSGSSKMESTMEGAV
ncbi:carbohydrate ABC transporter permease [Actinomyces urogenitalis]|uniref:carbohydrate ABC transporter permease n=1 Tax=Actinomyces urogenitalis TaxID=103621 RepID=UPI00050DC683|nr:sugar ABC transporter permease [Actinomyces urogenitalis]KGF04013.1 ABC transporter [Actinomyces urogenitalis S6-C4]MDU0863895.1 sugar ABC transporter permease [Actinomyces urogenitalis]MDU0874521.1 sugar ABC transporter permease [Actinomyces urogenitalis]MDU1564081.1 sugar ABC transporter permease [Actinomyces urogenitalis]MDU1639560.1 sugar ABC transporter permease [Actinomyces urogenitalis]